MLTKTQRIYKRVFDFTITVLIIPILIIPLILLVILATLDTGQFGLFAQTRIGENGRPFKLLKVRTLKGSQHESVEAIMNSKTQLGGWMRRSKLDELPQVFNILVGQMSWVGPRPDIPGYADRLEGEDRIMLTVKPGLTGPATLKYKHEEALLMKQDDPDLYNDTVLWPDKVRINMEYVRSWSLRKDIGFIWASIFGSK